MSFLKLGWFGFVIFAVYLLYVLLKFAHTIQTS